MSWRYNLASLVSVLLVSELLVVLDTLDVLLVALLD